MRELSELFFKKSALK